MHIFDFKSIKFYSSMIIKLNDINAKHIIFFCICIYKVKFFHNGETKALYNNFEKKNKIRVI